MGPGRRAETNAPAARARFLSNQVHASYEMCYERLVAPLVAQNIPFRMDEVNSCSSGGARDASDTFAATPWAFDCTHWRAAHHILGMNYHTGESVGRDGGFAAANYAAFVHAPGGRGFLIRPQAYALLPFTQGARGYPLATKVHSPRNFNFDGYAFCAHDGSLYVTLINKSCGQHAQTAVVSLQLPPGVDGDAPEAMNLTQADQDVAAKNGITLGGASIDPQGLWAGQWTKITNDSKSIAVGPAAATLLRFRAAARSAHQFPAAANE